MRIGGFSSVRSDVKETIKVESPVCGSCGLAKWRKFTLVELLVVISVICVLMSLLLPALNASKGRANSIQCVGKCREIGGAMFMYSSDYNGVIPHSGDAASDNISGGACPSWKQLLACYLNVSLTAYALEHGVFNCPSQKSSTCGNASWGDNGFYGGYGWNVANLGWRNAPEGGWPAWINISDIIQPSMTIAQGDVSDYYAGYTMFYIYSKQYCGSVLGEGYRHHGGGNYLWCDGHVSWLSNKDAYLNQEWFKVQK